MANPPFTPPPSSRVRATERFRSQHDELQALAFEIAQQLVATNLKDNAEAVRGMLRTFADKLRTHADEKNDALYPRLLRHRDPVVRAQAEGLFREVEGLYRAFSAYSEQWCTGTAIEDAPAEFVRATMQTFRLLGKRMLRENQELYPMVDRVG